MKHTIISLFPLVLLAAVTLVDFESLTSTPNNPASHDFDHQRNEGHVAFIVNESVHDATPKPDPDPAKCACKGTGLITHGDGHQTVCPYHGEDNNPDDGERDWKCDCDSEKKGTYCGCKEEFGKCQCDKSDVKKKGVSKMQELKKVYDVLSSISSKKGFKVDKFTITAKSPVTSRITMSDGEINIDFIDNTPVVTVRKIIKISISVLGITLMPSGGIIRLDNFPDMPFDYEEDGGIVSGLSEHFPDSDE